MKECFKWKCVRALIILLATFGLYSLCIKNFVTYITPYDMEILKFIRSNCDFIPQSLIIGITNLGIATAFGPCYTFIGGVALCYHKYRTILVLGINYLIFLPLIHFVKSLFTRERPDILFQITPETGYSFPSGHSITAALYCVLWIYLIHQFIKNKLIQKTLSAGIILWALSMMFSRMWLGVHYPTDIIGGALFGALWASFLILLIRKDY